MLHKIALFFFTVVLCFVGVAHAQETIKLSFVEPHEMPHTAEFLAPGGSLMVPEDYLKLVRRMKIINWTTPKLLQAVHLITKDVRGQLKWRGTGTLVLAPFTAEHLMIMTAGTLFGDQMPVGKIYYSLLDPFQPHQLFSTNAVMPYFDADGKALEGSPIVTVVPGGESTATGRFWKRAAADSTFVSVERVHNLALNSLVVGDAVSVLGKGMTKFGQEYFFLDYMPFDNEVGTGFIGGVQPNADVYVMSGIVTVSDELRKRLLIPSNKKRIAVVMRNAVTFQKKSVPQPPKPELGT